MTEPPSNLPANSELIAEAREIQEVLAHTVPSRTFIAGEIEHMSDLLETIISELRGDTPPKYTLNRPRDMGSFARSWSQITDTPEGRLVQRFFSKLARRAEALDLPLYPWHRR